MSTRSIVIAGSLAQRPGCGGHTWVFLQYLLGFRKLGWDVLFLDRLESGMCVDEAGVAVPIANSWNVRYFLDVMRRFGLSDSFGLLCDGGTNSLGLDRAQVLERVRRSSAIVNVMGFFNDDEILAAAPRRVFLDIDPGFGQMWQALGLHDIFRGHDAFVTIGENIGHSSCTIPTCGLSWVTTKPPVFLGEWPDRSASAASTDSITSVVSWRGPFGPIEYTGTTYGLRVHEFRKFVDLPALTGRTFELALNIHPADEKDRSLLIEKGWTLIAPQLAAGDPRVYREFVGQSAAEIMIAKGMYVRTRGGWFSDRSVCYLASGRPVIAQDTGLGALMPTGEGVLTFSTLEEAVEATRRVGRDPARHARAARRVAEEVFDSSIVLTALARKLAL